MSKKRALEEDVELEADKKRRIERDENMKYMIMMAIQTMEERQAEKERNNSLVGILSAGVTLLNAAKQSLFSSSGVSPLEPAIVAAFGDVMRTTYERQNVVLTTSFPDDSEKYVITIPSVHRLSCYTALAFSENTDGVFDARMNMDDVSGEMKFEFYYTKNRQVMISHSRSHPLVISNIPRMPPKLGETREQIIARELMNDVSPYIGILDPDGDVVERNDERQSCVVPVKVVFPVRMQNLRLALSSMMISDALFYTQHKSGELSMIIETALK